MRQHIAEFLSPHFVWRDTFLPLNRASQFPRGAYLQVLSGLETDPVRGGGSTATSGVQAALRTAQELNFSRETCSPQAGPSAGRCRRVIPGRSVLASAVTGAIVRRRLESSIFRRGVKPPPGRRRGESVDGAAGAAAERREEGIVDVAQEEAKEPQETTRLRLVVELLSASDVDVRDAAIKATKKFFGSAALRKAGVASSRESLMVWAGAAKALVAEGHPPNIRRLVRLLSRVGFYLRDDCSLPPPTGQLLWDHLRGLCECGPGDVHAGALEVMGAIIRLGRAPAAPLVKGEEGRSTLDVDEYASLLERAVDPGQPAATRSAAAASLASSGLLKIETAAAPAAAAAASTPAFTAPLSAAGGGAGAGACVRLWFVALSLLQDDDEGVRNRAARACAAAAAAGSSVADGAGGRAGERGQRVVFCSFGEVIFFFSTWLIW